MSLGHFQSSLACRRLQSERRDSLIVGPDQLGFLYVRNGEGNRSKLIYLHPAENDTAWYHSEDAGFMLSIDRDRLVTLPGLYEAAAFFRNYRPTRSVEINLTEQDVDPEPLFRMIMAQGEKSEETSAFVISACATLLLYLRQVLKYRLPYDALTQPHRLTGRFMELVEQYYSSHADVTFYAQKLLVTEDYLSRICKREFGLSAKEVIQSRRFDEAKRLLRTTSYRIKEIATKLGFESADYFSRAFKRYFGLGPEEYRRGNE